MRIADYQDRDSCLPRRGLASGRSPLGEAEGSHGLIEAGSVTLPTLKFRQALNLAWCRAGRRAVCPEINMLIGLTIYQTHLLGRSIFDFGFRAPCRSGPSDIRLRDGID
jgi:hypothetical protein